MLPAVNGLAHQATIPNIYSPVRSLKTLEQGQLLAAFACKQLPLMPLEVLQVYTTLLSTCAIAWMQSGPRRL